MILEMIVVGALQVNCFVLGCEETHQGMVIDPGDDAAAILYVLNRHHLSLASIVATHAHFDHVLAVRALQEKCGAPFYVHPADRPLLLAGRRTATQWLGIDPGEGPRVDGDLTPGETLRCGAETLEIRATPGHSPGSVSLVHHARRSIFAGDALFAGSIGRTDLYGGDMDTLLESIRTQILTLPDDYKVYSGHGPATTVGRERRTNPFLE